MTASVRDQSSDGGPKSGDPGSNSISSGAINHQKNTNNILVATTAYRKGPYFDRAASKNVTAMLGKTAYLNCRVKNLGNRTVSFFIFLWLLNILHVYCCSFFSVCCLVFLL